MDVGDIVFCPWLASGGNMIPHFGLVVRVDVGISEERVLVAYATSKHISSAYRDFEICLSSEDDIAAAGLTVTTVINLSCCQRINSNRCVKVGTLRLNDKAVLFRLRRAAIAARLI